MHCERALSVKGVLSRSLIYVCCSLDCTQREDGDGDGDGEGEEEGEKGVRSSKEERFPRRTVGVHNEPGHSRGNPMRATFRRASIAFRRRARFARLFSPRSLAARVKGRAPGRRADLKVSAKLSARDHR